MRAALLLLLFSAGIAAAHPVTQGTIEIQIRERTIDLRIRVSPEEVFVANSHSTSPAQQLEQAYADHASYLLHHVLLFADNQALAGQLTQHTLPQRNDPFPSYSFSYEVTRAPSTLRLEENVLNEIDYAPGNRWEASYLIKAKDDRHTITNGALLTSRERLTLVLSSTSNSWQTAADYIKHGINHILTGYDHLLFIAALALAVNTLWELFKIIAAFTLAHSITLTLSVLNIVRLPSQIVEPMIAASIVVVAAQNVFWPKQSHGSSRLLVAFFFGLFHGLGFAGGLLDAMSGMAGTSVALAIISFSVGVELGHQCVVLPLFGLTQIVRRTNRPRETNWLLRGGSAAISLAGMFYLVSAVTQLTVSIPK